MRGKPDNDAQLLELMLAAAKEARAICLGKTKQDFLDDRVLELAIEKLVQNIGEAASRLTRDFKTAHDDVPWAQMIGMRHRLVPDFNAVDPAVVWDTVSESLSALIEQLERMPNLAGDS